MLILIFYFLFQSQNSFATSPPSPFPTQSPPIPNPQKLKAPAPSLFKKGERIQFKSKDQTKKPIIIAPRWHEGALERTGNITYFELSQENHQLILSFRSKDPQLHLSHQTPLVVELITDPPFTVEPSIITSNEWPKDSIQMTLKTSGATLGRNYRILGKAAYSFCHMQTAVCTDALSTIIYSYRQ
jgi:hypothetical protein